MRDVQLIAISADAPFHNRPAPGQGLESRSGSKAGMSNTLPLVWAASGVHQIADPFRRPPHRAALGQVRMWTLQKSKAVTKLPLRTQAQAMAFDRRPSSHGSPA